tara:strand:+ start:212 stop:595 length:384 start_codon:yes stop_codon:yes gene_type:complete
MQEIECSFKPLTEWYLVHGEEGKKRCGHYSRSMLPVKGFGKTIWSVVAYIDVDYDEHRAKGLTDKEIVEGCVSFLNKPLTKRHRNSRYGKLALNWFNILEDKGVISTCLLIDQRNNKNFWGKGQKGR